MQISKRARGVAFATQQWAYFRRLWRLTPRETQCLCWRAQGFTIDQTRRRLGVKCSTVTTLLMRAYKRMGVHDAHAALLSLLTCRGRTERHNRA